MIRKISIIRHPKGDRSESCSSIIDDFENKFKRYCHIRWQGILRVMLVTERVREIICIEKCILGEMRLAYKLFNSNHFRYESIPLVNLLTPLPSFLAHTLDHVPCCLDTNSMGLHCNVFINHFILLPDVFD